MIQLQAQSSRASPRGTVTFPSLVTPHTFSFSPGADDFSGTDQIYVGSTQTPALATALNSLNQTGPVVQFFTIGIDPAALTSNHQLTLAINQLSDGGDG